MYFIAIWDVYYLQKPYPILLGSSEDKQYIYSTVSTKL